MISQPELQSAYDCVVMGGGPAGSTVAALVAQAGFSTLLVERERMPRFHVGESLMPETYWTLQRLGVWQQLQDSRFVKKYSVQFVNGEGQASQPFFFDRHDPRPCAQTWQVERADFDRLLFENAAAKGADCREATRVLDVLREGPRIHGVRLAAAAGAAQDIGARVVVDATGQQSLIASRLGLKQPIPELRKAAIWAYFQDAQRQPGPHGGATLVLHTRDQQAWFWYIPLSGGVTSVGLVADHELLLKRHSTPGDAYCAALGNCPALAERLQDATMVGDFRVAKEFSYTTSQHAGEGWVLVGDAFGFLDPIYSSGVFFALKTGEMAADAIVEGLREGCLTARQLGKWTDEFKAGMQWVRKLVDAFYTPEFSFGKFMKQFPQHQGPLTDLLIGRVFHDGAGAMFQDLDPMLADARRGVSERSV